MSRLTIALVLALPAAWLVAPGLGTAAAAEPPTCHGRPATIVGTDGADRLVGTGGPDVIAGLGGNDRISGGRGDDVVCGGWGADDLLGGRGDDALYGGRDEHRRRAHGSTVVTGDLLDGGPGDDTLNARVDAVHGGQVHRADTVTYRHSRHGVRVDLAAGTSRGAGHDTIARGDGLEILGSGHDDVLAGSGRRETLDGGAGDDRLLGRGGADVLLDYHGDDEQRGGRGRDFVISTSGVDVIAGGPSFDFLIAGSGRPATVRGGRGFDYVERPLSTGPTGVLDGGPGGNQLELDPSFYDDVAISVDRATGTAVAQHGTSTSTADFVGFGAFTLFGDARWSYRGTDAHDFLQVLGGSLAARTLGGDDTMIGDTGDDTLDGGDGTDEAWGGSGTNTCIEDETGDCDGYPWQRRTIRAFPSTWRLSDPVLEHPVVRRALAAYSAQPR